MYINESDIAYYNENTNKIYINSECVSPEIPKNLPPIDSMLIMGQVFALDINERVELFASDYEKDVICDLLSKHKGSPISIFCNSHGK